MLESGDVRIDCRVMDHAHGAWAGMRPQWYTATHVASGFSVTWHEHTDNGRGQHRDREAALACLDMLIDQMQPRALPLSLHDTQPKTTEKGE